MECSHGSHASRLRRPTRHGAERNLVFDRPTRFVLRGWICSGRAEYGYLIVWDKTVFNAQRAKGAAERGRAESLSALSDRFHRATRDVNQGARRR
jgi:hypothetical protein